MKRHVIAALLALCLAAGAQAQTRGSEASAVSALPVASAVGASLAIPAVLAVHGAEFVVRGVEASARSAVYVLERASDGARVSVEIVGRGLGHASVATGTVVTASVIGAGVVLSVAGEAIAFLPNAVGQALLHHERLTH